MFVVILVVEFLARFAFSVAFGACSSGGCGRQAWVIRRALLSFNGSSSAARTVAACAASLRFRQRLSRPQFQLFSLFVVTASARLPSAFLIAGGRCQCAVILAWRLASQVSFALFTSLSRSLPPFVGVGPHGE